MKRNLIAMILLSSAALQAQQPPAQKIDPACKAKHEKMMEARKARDAKLDRMLADLKSATGQKKVDLMGEILTELLSERQEMRAHMKEMEAMRKEGKGCQMGMHEMQEMHPMHPMQNPSQPGNPPADHSGHH